MSHGKDFGVFFREHLALATSARSTPSCAQVWLGRMPVGVVEADLANGSLVKIGIEDLPEGHLVHGDVGSVQKRHAARPRRTLVDRTSQIEPDQRMNAGL